MKYTTLILEPEDYSEKAIGVYKSLGPVFFYPDLQGKKRDAVLKQANIIVLRLKYKIDSSWLDKLPNLKIIATPTTGLNHVDLDEAKKRGIQVISLRGRSSFLKDIPSTAELTFALLFALIRHIPWAFDDVKKGRWNRDAWKGNQLIHKTLGIIGCGRLGKIIAKYGRTFGMKVIGYDPHVPEKTMSRFHIKKVTMEELLKNSDIVSVHVNLIPETKNLIKGKHFRMMKPNSLLINTARGEIIDERALCKALKSKWIAGAALDVMANESADGEHLKKSPLMQYAKKNKNLIIVPHIGGAAYEAMKVTEDFIANLVQNRIKK